MNIVTTTRTVACTAAPLAVPPVGSYARREKTILRILRLKCIAIFVLPIYASENNLRAARRTGNPEAPRKLLLGRQPLVDLQATAEDGVADLVSHLLR